MFNLSIDVPVDKGPVHSRSHYGSTVIIVLINNNPGSMMEEVDYVIMRGSEWYHGYRSWWIFLVSCDNPG